MYTSIRRNILNLLLLVGISILLLTVLFIIFKSESRLSNHIESFCQAKHELYQESFENCIQIRKHY